jgi:DNA helicase-2/ATP-dependent DNA helicase PcrA
MTADNTAAITTTIRQWSHYQQDLFSAFAGSEDSLLIEAVAGSGKTTVLVELSRIMAREMPARRGAFLAFNKGIAEELARRISAPNVSCMTLHSAGWSAWRRAGGIEWTPQLDSGKTHKIMRELLTWEEARRWGETTRKLVAFAKGAGIVPRVLPNSMMHDQHDYGLSYNGLVDDTPEAWQALIDHYGLDEDECNIPLVRKVLARGIEIARETCDFDDMLYMSVISGVPFDKYDVVLVDELQDLSGIQHVMIERMLAGGGRFIGVGDSHQSCYGFRGAVVDSMEQAAEKFQCRRLPLSVSYRCPQAVVLHAQQWVPQIEYAADAQQGYVGLEGTDWAGQTKVALGAPIVCTCFAEDGEYCPTHGNDQGKATEEGISKWRGLSDFHPGDAILCRLTRPLIEAAFTLIRGRVACRVLGRDIGKGLTDLVRKSKLRDSEPVGFFHDWLGRWAGKQRARLRAKQEWAKLGLLEDKLATLEVFMDELSAIREPEGLSPLDSEPTVGMLIREIESLFVDNDAAAGMVTLATVHKAKGLEWGRVFVLDAGECMPCRWARQPWEMVQERNLMYVAATRAMRELRYITSDDLRRKP